MNLVYCITRSDTIGGAHVHVGDMAAYVKSLGCGVSVVVGGSGPFTDLLRERGVPFYTSRYLRRQVSPVADMAAVLELRTLFKRLDPQIISLHSAKAGLLGRLAAAGLNSRVVFTAHGWSFTEGIPTARAKFYCFLERQAARLADQIVTVSDYDRDLALDANVGRSDQIVTIHNGMPDSARTASPGGVDDGLRIVMVARLDKQKDHITLFEALSSLREGRWLVDLIGDGPLEGVLRQRAAEMGIGERINFLGLQSDVEEVLVRSNIFVLASHWEGFPRSILEAMRAALPVIASDVGGVREAVVDGETGYLVPRGGAQQLAERLSWLIGSPEQRERLGRAGRARFSEQFRFDRMARKTLRLYEDLAGITA